MRFPTPDQLLPLPAAFLGDEPGNWAERLVDHQWGRLLDELSDDLATPGCLFFRNIEKTVEQIFAQERAACGFDDKYSPKLFYDIAVDLWKYSTWMTLPGQIDAAFLTIEQFGNLGLSPNDHEKYRAIRSALRRKLGLDARPGKRFSEWGPAAKTEQRRGLSRILNTRLLAENLDGNSESSRARIIAALYVALGIATDAAKAAENVLRRDL